MTADLIDFANAARALSRAAAVLGLRAPTFRSPPRIPGSTRTIRTHSDGTCTVAVSLRGRPRPAVLADMVEGVVAANGLSGAEAGRFRDALWEFVEAGHRDLEEATAA
ncbi:MAG: hypothetical protein KatS3mg008_1915 [Acidimicrobiales bacterium]|nr:MAG: hypothetical protein KatS3mg008_1915 [Acidimicrobiales bacterium]